MDGFDGRLQAGITLITYHGVLAPAGTQAM